MKYIHGTEDFTLDKDSAVTLGKFDGVHMGHQKLISIVEEKAKQNNILAAAFTFDRIPLSICPQRQQHFITTNSERRAFMESLGINALIEYPFTEKLMNTDAGEFIEDIIREVSEISPSKYIHIGGDEADSTSKEDYKYFMGRVSKIVENHGKVPIGWDPADTSEDISSIFILQNWSCSNNVAREKNLKLLISKA